MTTTTHTAMGPANGIEPEQQQPARQSAEPQQHDEVQDRHPRLPGLLAGLAEDGREPEREPDVEHDDQRPGEHRDGEVVEPSGCHGVRRTGSAARRFPLSAMRLRSTRGGCQMTDERSQRYGRGEAGARPPPSRANRRRSASTRLQNAAASSAAGARAREDGAIGGDGELRPEGVANASASSPRVNARGASRPASTAASTYSSQPPAIRAPGSSLATPRAAPGGLRADHDEERPAHEQRRPGGPAAEVRSIGHSHARSRSSRPLRTVVGAESSCTGSGGTTSSTESGRTSVTFSGSRCSVTSRLGDCAYWGVTSIGDPLAVRGLHLGPHREVLRAADAAVAGRQTRLRRGESGAQHDARGEAELARDERHRDGELLVVADRCDVVAGCRGPRIGLALEQTREQRVDPCERVTGGAGLEPVARQRLRPRGGFTLREAVAEVPALAQQRHETGQCRAPRTRRVLVDPRAQALRRGDTLAHAARGFDDGEVDAQDARHSVEHVGVAGLETAAGRLHSRGCGGAVVEAIGERRGAGARRSRPTRAGRRSASRCRRGPRP